MKCAGLINVQNAMRSASMKNETIVYVQLISSVGIYSMLLIICHFEGGVEFLIYRFNSLWCDN